MKLKEIPSDTVVHTPTEAEAKELLAILHENGYSWGLETFLTEKSHWSNFAENTCYRITKYVVYGHRYWYESNSDTTLTLAEFKRLYCDFDDTFTDDCKSSVKVEKPQLKDIGHAIVCNGFNKDGIKDGDKVLVLRYDNENFMAMLNPAIGTIIPEKNLEPYTGPETKPTEDMETKDYPPYLDRPKTVVETPKKELNLCELLQGHENESIDNLKNNNICQVNIKQPNNSSEMHKPCGVTLTITPESNTMELTIKWR